MCISVKLGKMLRFSNIHLILEGGAGNPVKLIQVHKLLQKKFFLSPQKWFIFLKIHLLFRQKKNNLHFNLLAIEKLIRHIIFWKLTELFP